MKNPRVLLASLCGVAALVAVSLASRAAEARLIDLHAGGRVGGLTGWGTTGNTPDFFEEQGGAGAGFSIGAKLLIIELSIDFTQLFNGGTLTQGLLGFNVDIPVGTQRFQDGIERGKSRNIVRPMLMAGGALGTPQTISLPLDDAQISQKGFVSYAGVAFEHFLNPFVGVGAQASYGYHYLVGGGKSMFAANQKHSAGYQVDGFATLTFHLGY